MKAKFLACVIGCALSFSVLAEQTDLKLIGTQGTQYFFTLSKPWILDAGYVEGVAKNFCSGKRMCMAHFWEAGTPAATRLPMTDAQVRAEMATFQNGRMLWRCGQYVVANSSNCFSD